MKEYINKCTFDIHEAIKSRKYEELKFIGGTLYGYITIPKDFFIETFLGDKIVIIGSRRTTDCLKTYNQYKRNINRDFKEVEEEYLSIKKKFDNLNKIKFKKIL